MFGLYKKAVNKLTHTINMSEILWALLIGKQDFESKKITGKYKNL